MTYFIICIAIITLIITISCFLCIIMGMASVFVAVSYEACKYCFRMARKD